jgi:CHAT domain-containing protein
MLGVTNGALSSWPIQLLITKDPTGKSLKDTDWFVRSHAITNLPSVASLKALRETAVVSSATKTMIAFADPVFSRATHENANIQANKNVAIRGLARFATGTQIDIRALGEYLQERPIFSTRNEVKAIAKVLQVDADDLHFGLDATETAVKNAKLDQYRIVYFATHGFVAGALEDIAKAKIEPSLALSFPDNATEIDDGLLTASEVAQLKLDADWVVLSACNTAAEEKPGAEALSGLARAFF